MSNDHKEKIAADILVDAFAMNDQRAYALGADIGISGKPWSIAASGSDYQDLTSDQRKAFIEGFEYGKWYLEQSGD